MCRIKCLTWWNSSDYFTLFYFNYWYFYLFYLKCISIPVEIVPQTNPSYRTYQSTSSSSSWKKPTNRFQPRQTPITAYDRLINNSPSYQPYYPHRIYETNLSRSNEDLLSSSRDSRDTKYSKYNNSDFIQTNKNSFRRSYDVLNDYPEESYKNCKLNKQHRKSERRRNGCWSILW